MYSLDDVSNDIKSKFTPEFFEKIKLNTYNEDRAYPENFSNWYNCIEDFGNFKHAEIINNQILQLEETSLLEQEFYNRVDADKLKDALQPTIQKMIPNRQYSLKNGCFSNKFDFNESIVTRDTLCEKLWKLNYNSTMLDTGGFTEVVVRELIPYNYLNTCTIYNGLPLREEMRVFYNFNNDTIEYMVDYWDYLYCHSKLSLTDKIVFDWYTHSSAKYKYLKELKQFIIDNIHTLRFNDNLKGIWSIDFMMCRNMPDPISGIYLIDMARGYRSAYWDYDKLSEYGKKVANSMN